MTEFKVMYVTTLMATRSLEIEADTEDEATEKAYELAEDPDFFFEISAADGWNVEYAEQDDEVYIVPEDW